MSRVYPRDIFNQANLLENLGHLYIELENLNLEKLFVDQNSEEESFEMIVSGMDNTQSIKGLYLKMDGELCSPWRSINSRERYSIYITHPETEEEYEVFDQDGKLSSDLLNELNKDNTIESVLNEDTQTDNPQSIHPNQ